MKEKITIIGMVLIALLAGCVNGPGSGETPATVETKDSVSISTTVTEPPATSDYKVPLAELDYPEAGELVSTDLDRSLNACLDSGFPQYCIMKVFCATDDETTQRGICDVMTEVELSQGMCFDVFPTACSDPLSASKLCDGYQNPYSVASCKSKVAEIGGANGLGSQSISVCEGIGLESFRFECFISLAVLDRDQDICEGIGVEPWRSNCLRELALAYSDPVTDGQSTVDEVPAMQEPVDAGSVQADESVVRFSDPARFSEFLDLLDKNVSASLEACMTSKFSDYCRDHIFCTAAKSVSWNESGNESGTEGICSFLEVDPRLCVNVYMEACNDPMTASKGCAEYVVGEKDVAVCRAAVAEFGNSQGLAEESLQVCEEIEVDFVGFQCFTVLAVMNYDPDVCRKIGDVKWADACFYEIGTAYRDGDACGLVTDEGMRADCLGEIKSGYSLD